MLKIKFLIISGIIITLALGFALGIIAERDFFHNYSYLYTKWTRKEIPQEQLLSILVEKLELTTPQIQTIGGILRMQGFKIKELQNDFQGKLTKIKQETMDKINIYLSEDQKEKYKETIETHKSSLKNINQ